ncbi:hypothetical protein WIS52_00545 [Pseudonocardia nematodicida]|uniref:ASCH domain-containing protein n=1 Tax=Pseudonocardia nematodicida TaxID=1206997 RepID=A0ABV1K3A4_9PSEU
MFLEPFRGSVAVAGGLLSKGKLRGPHFRKLFPDIYVHASVRITPVVRARAAALFVDRCGGAAGGFSAAEVQGASCGSWREPAEVLVTGRVRSHPGLLVRRGDLTGSGFADGVRVTSPLGTAWDLARRLDLEEAVVAVDALGRRRAERPVFVPYPPGRSPDPDTLALSRLRSPPARGSIRPSC